MMTVVAMQWEINTGSYYIKSWGKNHITTHIRDVGIKLINHTKVNFSLALLLPLILRFIHTTIKYTR